MKTLQTVVLLPILLALGAATTAPATQPAQTKTVSIDNFKFDPEVVKALAEELRTAAEPDGVLAR